MIRLFQVLYVACLSLSAVTADAGTRDLDQVVATRLHLEHSPAYTSSAVDLSGDGRPSERLILIREPGYCGSGGCVLLALAQQRSGWRVVMQATVSSAPIYVLAGRSHGWRDLAVTVGGGGAPRRLAWMKFDGRRYPSNPSLQPSVLRGAKLGKPAIAN